MFLSWLTVFISLVEMEWPWCRCCCDLCTGSIHKRSKTNLVWSRHGCKTGCYILRRTHKILSMNTSKKKKQQQKNMLRTERQVTERHCCFLTSPPSMHITRCFQHIHFQLSISHDQNSGATRPLELQWRIQVQAHRRCTRKKVAKYTWCAWGKCWVRTAGQQSGRRWWVKNQMTFIVN